MFYTGAHRTVLDNGYTTIVMLFLLGLGVIRSRERYSEMEMAII